MEIPQKEITLKNNLKFTLRSPREADASLFLEHMVRVSEESFLNLNRDASYWDKVSAQDEKKIIQHILESKNAFHICAFDTDKIMGTISIQGMQQPHQRTNGELGISIEKNFHGSGLGTALMEYGLECAKMIGLHSVKLNVRTFNTAGIMLYEKLGFRRVGELKEVAYIQGKFYDEYIYQKLL